MDHRNPIPLSAQGVSVVIDKPSGCTCEQLAKQAGPHKPALARLRPVSPPSPTLHCIMRSRIDFLCLPRQVCHAQARGGWGGRCAAGCSCTPHPYAPALQRRRRLVRVAAACGCVRAVAVHSRAASAAEGETCRVVGGGGRRRRRCMPRDEQRWQRGARALVEFELPGLCTS